jgi:hypothetical protein
MIRDANICKTCSHSKDRFKESCYCTMYGIIVTYGKSKCNEYEPCHKKDEEDLQCNS